MELEWSTYQIVHVQRALTFDVQKDFSFRITHITTEEKIKTSILYGTKHLVKTPLDITSFEFFFYYLEFQKVITNQQGKDLWKQIKSNKAVLEI